MIDTKWVLYCKKKKRNALVSTKSDRYMSYQDLCSACGYSIYKKHEQAHLTAIIPEEKIEIKKGVKTNKNE